MTIGVILTGFNMEEYVGPCLDAWRQARDARLDGHDFLICAVSVPFAGFPVSEEDDTVECLAAHLVAGRIDHLIAEPRNIPETTARGMALNWLTLSGADIVWQVDIDEMYEFHEIARIVEFVDANPWAAWFRLSLKNYVFDEQTYLTEPFTPPRIHRVRVDGYRAHSFSGDNDIQYGGAITRDIVPQSRFPSVTVPPSVAWVKHLTWQNNDRSRRKIEYQLQGRGWPQCSFAWDDTKGLVFNPALPVPKVARDT